MYKLLGMMRPEDREKIPINYGPDVTVQRVLFAVAKAHLLEEGPDILVHCRDTPLWAEGLPT